MADEDVIERAATTLQGLWAEVERLRALADLLAEALRASYAMDMTHLQRVQAHNATVRAMAAYEAARKETNDE